MKQTTGSVRFEDLETRTMLAGHPLSIAEVDDAGGMQLRISGTSRNDRIIVTRTADGLLVRNRGWSTLRGGNYTSLLIDGRSGHDAIVVDGSVMVDSILYGSSGNDTVVGGGGDDRVYGGSGKDRLFGGAGDDVLVGLGGGTGDLCVGGAGSDSFWVDTRERIVDATSAEIGSGAVHRIGQFSPYSIADAESTTTIRVNKELYGQSLSDPVATHSVLTNRNFASRPLFSDAGPSADDVKQGAVGDCYFLAVLSSLAETNPNLIRQSVVDLGDGTYAVQFVQSSGKTFVRVDADLPAYGSGAPAYAGLGAQGALWVAIMEKAFTFFRSGEGTYESISAGWMGEAYDALGTPNGSRYSSSGASWLMQTIKAGLDAGKSVTYAVWEANGAPLIGCHAYMVDAVVTDTTGAITGLRLRNPWGIDGAGWDGKNDGYVTITPAQAHAAFLGLTIATV